MFLLLLTSLTIHSTDYIIRLASLIRFSLGFFSYLSSRLQRNFQSDLWYSSAMHRSFPFSSLCTLLFCLPLPPHIKHHLCADDSQDSETADNVQILMTRTSTCWITDSKLIIYDDKTETILSGLC